MILSLKWFIGRFGPHFLLFVLLLGGFLFVHRGMVVPLQKEIAAKETAWQAERPKIGQLTTLKTAQQDLMLFRQRLPEETALPEVVSFVSESAAAHRLSIPAISYQPENVGGPGLMRVLISFSVKGNYRDIRNLIYRLEQSRYFLVLENLMLASSSREGEAIQLQLRIAAYFHPGKRS
jgi:Tfp pilus assembly protein PilO